MFQLFNYTGIVQLYFYQMEVSLYPDLHSWLISIGDKKDYLASY